MTGARATATVRSTDPPSTRTTSSIPSTRRAASAIVARHGGTVRHLPTPGGGATFRMELPGAPDRDVVDDGRDLDDDG